MSKNEIARSPQYDAGDFLELEEHLCSEHRSGKHFSKLARNHRLQFCNGPAEEAVYRLDFVPKGMKRSDYLAQISAYGWESCGILFGWECLKHIGTDADPQEIPLFHNTEDRAIWMRQKSDRNSLLSCVPLAVLIFASRYLDTAHFTNSLWILFFLFLILAIAVVLPNYRIRNKLAHALSS